MRILSQQAVLTSLWLCSSLFLAKSQVCEPYSGTECEGYGSVYGGVQPMLEAAVNDYVGQMSVTWFKQDCKAAIRKIVCAGVYSSAGANCGGFTYCQADCFDLAASACGYYMDSNNDFATAMFGMCSQTDPSGGCESSDFEMQLQNVDKTSCPKPLEVRPSHLNADEYIEDVPHTGCVLPCENVLFTDRDQTTVRVFGLIMSASSLVLCTVALWVFLSQPDIAMRRKSLITASTATNSTRNSGQGQAAEPTTFRDRMAHAGEALAQFAQKAKEGRLMAGHSKAQIWKIVLFAGAWINALVSLIFDCTDIQNPVGCRGKAIILRYQPMAVFKAMVNFWVHFFSILIMGYLARNLYLSALGLSEVGPRVEKEFSRVLAVIFFLSFAVVIACLAIDQYGYDFGSSSAFMMQTHERDPFYGIISALGFLNLAAAAFVFMFLYMVPFKAVPKSAMMLVASFLLYFLTSAGFVALAIFTFGVYAEDDAMPAIRKYVACLVDEVKFTSDSSSAGIEACGSYASDDRISIIIFLYFKLWQSGYSILTCLAWAPLIGRRVWASFKTTFMKQSQDPTKQPVQDKHSGQSDQRQPTPRARSGSIRRLAHEAENDFSRIAHNVKKGWDAMKNAVNAGVHRHSSQHTESYLEDGYSERPSNHQREGDEVDGLFAGDRLSKPNMLPTIPSANFEEFSEFPHKNEML